jgi:tetratricopeptide (TPR) repeat protein
MPPVSLVHTAAPYFCRLHARYSIASDECRFLSQSWLLLPKAGQLRCSYYRCANEAPMLRQAGASAHRSSFYRLQITRGRLSLTRATLRPSITAPSRTTRSVVNVFIAVCSPRSNSCSHAPSSAAQMGQLEQAIADYSRAIELEPRNANAYHNRGSTADKVCRERPLVGC